MGIFGPGRRRHLKDRHPSWVVAPATTPRTPGCPGGAGAPRVRRDLRRRTEGPATLGPAKGHSHRGDEHIRFRTTSGLGSGFLTTLSPGGQVTRHWLPRLELDGYRHPVGAHPPYRRAGGWSLKKIIHHELWADNGMVDGEIQHLYPNSTHALRRMGYRGGRRHRPPHRQRTTSRIGRRLLLDENHARPDFAVISICCRHQRATRTAATTWARAGPDTGAGRYFADLG